MIVLKKKVLPNYSFTKPVPLDIAQDNICTKPVPLDIAQDNIGGVGYWILHRIDWRHCTWQIREIGGVGTGYCTGQIGAIGGVRFSLTVRAKTNWKPFF